jgi:hypothetical protein
MGRELEDPYSPEDMVARALLKVSQIQQPFYESLLGQLQAIERRLRDQGQDLTSLKGDVAVILDQQLVQKIADLDKRVDALEKAENIRKGLLLATTIAPKVIMALVIVVAGILAYLKLPNIPHIP